MRLGLVIYGSLDTISGGYLYDRMLVKHFRQADDTVEIISLPWRNYAEHLTDNFSPSLLNRLQSGKYDALLQDELNHPSLFWLNRRLRGRYPLISIVHHLRASEARPAWQNSFYRRVERRYLASVDGFIFNSEATKKAVESLRSDLTGLLRPVRSLVAYPAADHLHPALTADDIRTRAREAGPLRLLFVGNVIPRKGLHTLLAAAARLKTEDWRLEIVGSLAADAGHTASVKQQIRKNRLLDNVVLRGSLGEAELANEFARSQVLVVPSSYEGFGIVYLEGMAFGLPSMATTAGAAGEIITHGENGFLISPNDVEALADHLQTLANDRERLLAMSLAARERYNAHPTWEQSAERIRNFLHQIAAEGAGFVNPARAKY